MFSTETNRAVGPQLPTSDPAVDPIEGFSPNPANKRDAVPDTTDNTDGCNGVGHDIDTVEGVDEAVLNNVYDALRHPWRRDIIRIVSTADGAVSVQRLAAALDNAGRHDVSAPPADAQGDKITTALMHVHLPKLAELGLVSYGVSTGMVARTSQTPFAMDVLETTSAVLAEQGGE